MSRSETNYDLALSVLQADFNSAINRHEQIVRKGAIAQVYATLALVDAVDRLAGASQSVATPRNVDTLTDDSDDELERAVRDLVTLHGTCAYIDERQHVLLDDTGAAAIIDLVRKGTR